METQGRRPLGILERQNATRVPELVPLRTERMSASPFAFYRGTAALMAADLARGPSSQILVASCGDAHVANFGLYASPQRTLVFDLNDFDEAAWAPWEWDLKRLVTSIVVAGQATVRDDRVIREAARAAIGSYLGSLTAYLERSPLARYFEHFTVEGGPPPRDRQSRKVIETVSRAAQKRTGERAARKLTEADGQGRLRFAETPPTMTHLTVDLAALQEKALTDYLATTSVDIRMLLEHYTLSDTVRRVVGVGSVGTRCYLSVLQDGDGNALLLQTKEAGPSVLVEYGGCKQPERVAEQLRSDGDGARVVALQRILQGVSDPFLGFMRGTSNDFYVRQFRDMKGGVEMENLDDGPFESYARLCGTTLARAHSQSPEAGIVVGYIGKGGPVTDAILEWCYAYAALSRADYDAFIAAQPDVSKHA